jgi:KipI family sensor histidine kinase inhibitor
MFAALNHKRIADDLIEITASSLADAQALATQLRSNPVFIDTVAGYESVCVRFDPSDFLAALDTIKASQVTLTAATIPIEAITIPVLYGGDDGPDLERVCADIGLSPDAFIALHTELIHKIDLLGFTPGFAYMSGLPETISVPRLSTPRARVVAGSIGVSRQQTGIYAMAGPGGWPIIGRTHMPLFDPEAASPFKLSPRMKVKFEAIPC